MHQHHDRYRLTLDAGQALKIGAIGLVCLAVILFLVGCNTAFFGGKSSGQLSDKFWAGVRPPSGETERLLRNFRYLKAAGRTQLALRELEEAHQRDPDNLKIIDILAQCYEELGEWNRAEKLYLEALARDQDNPALANNLCFSYYLAGRFDKAESCFRDLLKRQPQNATVRNNLGLLLAKTGRQEEAYRLWREQESDAVARDRLNQALAALGLSPQTNLALRSKPDGAKEAAAVAAPPAKTSVPPVRAQTKTAPALTSSAQKEQPLETRPAPALPGAPQVATPVPSEKPVQPVTLSTASEQEVGQVAASVPSTVPVTTSVNEPGVSSQPRLTSHLAQPAAKVKNTAPIADNRAVAPAVKSVPTPVPSAAAPMKTQVKTAAPATPKLTPQASPVSAPIEPKRKEYLTAQERVNTRLEIKNGNGIQGIAALNRTWLTVEGFRVAAIGNHIDFGLKNTVIHYQPQAERVAQVLKEDFFPQADLKPSGKLGKDADVRITLGHDQKSRKSQIAERIALLDLRAQLAVILASSAKPEPSPSVAAKTKPAETQTVLKSRPAPAAPAPAAVSEPVHTQPITLSAADLTKTKIELRNGNGVQDQARNFRSRMEGQGFNVVRIKNHIDFGMQQTKILYRPGSERVAQALGQKYFRMARVEETTKLPENVDVKVILGKDLSGGLDLMAKLAN